MEIQYIGHAGLLIREDDVVIAFDPFLSGQFLWNGKLNTYTGNSPWIGSTKNIDAFIDRFAEDLTAILISHAHLDHFDPITIVRLLERNPEIQVYAPRPVTDWLKASSVADPSLSRFFAPIAWDGEYDIEPVQENQNGELKVFIMPNSGIAKEKYPYRVGYLIQDHSNAGLFLPGDSSATEWWDSHKENVTHIITWGKAVRKGMIDYFEPHQHIAKIWLIHWESFEPGNFDCSQDPNEFIEIAEDHGVPCETLDYEKWIKIEK